jgi:hypothetical protein
MPRFYVSIADANRILDTGQECLTLEHAKKLAVQTAEEMARNKKYSHQRGKYVQVTDERGNLYRVPVMATLGRFPKARESDSTWRTKEVRHVGSDTVAP